jgi:hypothetical protein
MVAQERGGCCCWRAALWAFWRHLAMHTTICLSLQSSACPATGSGSASEGCTPAGRNQCPLADSLAWLEPQGRKLRQQAPARHLPSPPPEHSPPHPLHDHHVYILDINSSKPVVSLPFPTPRCRSSSGCWALLWPTPGWACAAQCWKPCPPQSLSTPTWRKQSGEGPGLAACVWYNKLPACPWPWPWPVHWPRRSLLQDSGVRPDP